MGEWVGPVTQWRCLSCGKMGEGFAGGALCRRCDADEAEAWQEFDRASNDHDAAIETLRVMLTDIAGFCAGEARAGWKADDNERRACIAIALALLL